MVSNVGPVKTVELVGSEHLDKGYIKHVKERMIPTPLIWIHFASD